MDTITNYLLFSHTYLDQLAGDTLHDEKAAELAHGLRDWLPSRDATSLCSLVDTWVGPVLDFLAFSRTEVLADPHVILLQGQGGDAKPAGLCYVVEAGSDLNGTIRGAHPMAQAVMALRQHDLRWGMLTDGVRWRLLDAMSLRRYEAYLQVDLDRLALSADPGPLRLFYACFHRQAFDPFPNDKAGLERLYEASEKATETAEHHLKARVSNQDGIMAQLCRGLIAATGRLKFTDEDRDQIYQDATYLLYRMLFILHAEARDLLPMSHPDYAAASLTALVATARSYQSDGLPEPHGTGLWDRLKRLCTAIYESDPGLDIPAYNGGLFDDADKPYLRSGHIADQYLAPALCDLGCLPDATLPNAYRCVDYRDLSVRHLGNLYEGMIEYRLFVAEEPMIGRRDDKGNVRYLTQAEAGLPKRTDQEIATGGVYFAQSAGERRSTGTYYTPEFIVDHIVYETVIRKLRERRASLEAKIRVWLAQIAATRDPQERARMQRVVDKALLDFVESQVLTFRCCDPAMGSGHFLVNVAHQITNFIVETLHLASWPSAEVDADPAAWRRRVVEHCLYGVDLSPMAVELAKLSLWLATMSEGKPLSFLDHRLRRGNSLVGARLSDLQEALIEKNSESLRRQEAKARRAGQLLLIDEPEFRRHVTAATALLSRITACVADSVEDVKVQAGEYERVRRELAPYRRLADVYLARSFGISMTDRHFREIARYLTAGTLSPVPDYERLLLRADYLARTIGFFHWQLEFPEIHFDDQGRVKDADAGFQCMVGNPPYDVLAEKERQEDLNLTIAYIARNPIFRPALGGKLDLYRLFVPAAHRQTVAEGLIGLIVPMSLLADQQTSNLRSYCIRENSPIRIDAFPHKDDPERRVFRQAKLATCVFIMKKGPQPEYATEFLIHPANRIQETLGIVTLDSAVLQEFDTLFGRIPLVKSMAEVALLRRLHVSSWSDRFADHLTTFQGEVNETTHRIYLSECPDTGPKVNRGGNVQRYDFTPDAKQGTNLFLDEPRFLQRYQTGKVTHVTTQRFGYQRKAALNNWRRLIFCELPANAYCFDSVSYFLDEGIASLYALALLNSQLLEWRFSLTSSNNTVSTGEIGNLPYRRINFVTPERERARLVAQEMSVYEQGDFAQVLQDVELLLSRPASSDETVGDDGERSDVVYELLANLARHMLNANRMRRSEMERFLRWLERTLGTQIEELANRTRLQDYLGNYQKGGSHLGFTELCDILKQNHRLLSVEIDDSRTCQQLEVEYQGTLKKLLPLKERLDATDRLIDMIIYRLYGLTEDDIAVVEGRS